MNTPLRRIGIAMIAMIVLLLGNATYIQVVKADSYRLDSRNNRVLYDEYARERGTIIAQYGGTSTVLATSEPAGGQFQYLRTYRAEEGQGEVFANVTGYHSWRYGRAGLERWQNDFLAGNDPRLFVRRLSDLVTGRDPKGGHVQVGISPAAQRAAYDAMISKGYVGAVVAIEPDTGRILAMVSTPTYDPNRLATHDPDEQEQAWTEWKGPDPGCGSDQPLCNRAISQTYPPGSTFKLVVAAAALEDGADKDTSVQTAASVTPPGTDREMKNHSGACPGGTLEAAIVYSCNTAFGQLAHELGADKLADVAENFGISIDDIAIPMPVAASQLGDLESADALYRSGIGQWNVRLTPLQDAMLAATIANGGMAMSPHLVTELQAPDFSTVATNDPGRLTGNRALSQRNAAVLRDMMVAAENSYSDPAGNKQPAGVIAGKTGTAQHGTPDEPRPDHGWYTAFAPSDDPKIAVAVIVENADDFGANTAAPVGRAVIDAVLEEGS